MHTTCSPITSGETNHTHGEDQHQALLYFTPSKLWKMASAKREEVGGGVVRMRQGICARRRGTDRTSAPRLFCALDATSVADPRCEQKHAAHGEGEREGVVVCWVDPRWLRRRTTYSWSVSTTQPGQQLCAGMVRFCGTARPSPPRPLCAARSHVFIGSTWLRRVGQRRLPCTVFFCCLTHTLSRLL